jgi:hypothetical protein
MIINYLRSGNLKRLFFPVLFCCLLWALLFAEVSLAQSDEMPFSADVAPGSDSYKTGYYLIEAAPGETVTESLLLRNLSDAPITLHIQSVDATTGPLGGVSYGLPDEPVEIVGTWVTLPAKVIELAPREAKTIPVSISVPAEATSGDHVAGVAIWQPRAEDPAQPEAGGTAVTTQSRRILAVQVVVPGDAEPLLVIDGITPVVKPTGMQLELNISNVGELLTSDDGYIEVVDEGFRQDFKVATFVPGTSIAYPIKWTNDPEEKAYQACVVLHYEENTLTAEWCGSFTIGPELIAQEAARVGDTGGNRLLYAALLAIALGLVGFFMILAWRRRRDSEEGDVSIPVTPVVLTERIQDIPIGTIRPSKERPGRREER